MVNWEAVERDLTDIGYSDFEFDTGETAVPGLSRSWLVGKIEREGGLNVADHIAPRPQASAVEIANAVSTPLFVRMVDTHGTFEEAVSNSDEDVRRLAVRLRELITDVYPDAVEVPWPKQGTVGYGVGPKKMSEHFCYLDLHADHANLGFNHGVELPDPNGILEGTGKKFRHVKISDEADIERAALHELLEAAVEERRDALDGDT